jgi:hypothetical protein
VVYRFKDVLVRFNSLLAGKREPIIIVRQPLNAQTDRAVAFVAALGFSVG